MGSPKKILIAPLDWGLGHATRCMPMIEYLLAQGMEVELAGNGRSGELLKTEYPRLHFHELPEYGFHYSKNGNLVLQVMVQIPKVLEAIRKEHVALTKILKATSFDLIISDNRYGLYSKEVKSVIITHQLHLIMPFPFQWLQPFSKFILKSLYDKFDELWIPDVKGHLNLSGNLSHMKSIQKKARYIGWLSRFKGKMGKREAKDNNYLAILSGPEPQRTVLEEKLISILNRLNGQSIIVQGKTERKEVTHDGQVKLISSCTAQQLMELISDSSTIISRSGYSSVMDYVRMGIPAILIPTPGQTEQEYLAKHLSRKRIFNSIYQESVSAEKIKAAIEKPLCHEFSSSFFNQFKLELDRLIT